MLKQRPYHENDWQQVADLLIAYRTRGYINRYPTIWRLHMLMTSRLWEPERDARLWEDATGRVVGFAALTRRQKQGRGIGLERILDPDADQPALSVAQLEWAEKRACEFAAEVGESVMLSTAPLEMNMSNDMRLLEDAGLRLAAKEFAFYMACSLKRPFQEPALPAGFSLAPVPESELESYQSLYGFTPVADAHRRDLMRSPEYWHFVAKALDGQMAAYIECSVNRAEWAQNQRHIGWIDYIGTAEAFKRRGLAKALMLAGFDWLEESGANEARLVTGSDNTAAQKLYESVGMFLAEKEPAYLKNIPPLATDFPG
jgi:mycothiol synthase